MSTSEHNKKIENILSKTPHYPTPQLVERMLPVPIIPSSSIIWTGQQTFSIAPVFSTMTAGSVFFAGTAGILSQDNANFFWDNTNAAGTQLLLRPAAYTQKGLVIKGAASQSANLQEWQKSDGTVYASIIGGVPAASNVGVLTIYDKGLTKTGTGAVLSVHADNSSPYLAKFYNDTKSSTAANFVYYGYDNGDFLEGTLLGKYYFGAGGNESAGPTIRLTIDNTTGNVGIGTTSPSYPLHVKASGADFQASFDATTGTQYSGVYFSNNGTNKIQIGWDNTNSRCLISTLVANASIRMSADASGVANSLVITNSGVGVNVASGSIASQLHIIPGSASTKGIIVQAATSQSANLLELQNSSGSSVSYFDAQQRLVVGSNANSGTAFTVNGSGAAVTTVNINGGVRGSLSMGSTMQMQLTNTTGYSTDILQFNSSAISFINSHSAYGLYAGLLESAVASHTTWVFSNTYGNASGTSGIYDFTLLLDGGYQNIIPKTTASVPLTINANPQLTVTNKALTSNVATLTVTQGVSQYHGLIVGDTITVAGVDATFNGTYTITAVSTTTVSYALVHADVASTASGGTVTATQTGNLLNFKNQAGTVLTQFTPAGNLAIGVANGATGTIPLDVWSNASGNIMQFATSAGGGQAIRIGVDTSSLAAFFQLSTSNTYGYEFRSHTGAAVWWKIDSSGNFLGGTDNSFDIGASGATRPRTAYLGTSLNVVAGAVVADTNGVTLASGKNIILNTTTGTKIGTATNQLLGFWNASPIAQPTTAIAAATFIANTSGIANDTATFDGYTLGQVVKALRNAGLLA